MLVAQFWMLGPAGFAPFVPFGVQWVDPMYIEDAALHFFFMGWALPIAFAGLLLSARNLPCFHDRIATTGPAIDLTGVVPAVISRSHLVAWNAAIVLVGIGFFYQNQAWSAFAFGPGYAVIIVIWLFVLARIARAGRNHRTDAAVPAT